ncbi:MAG: T9SS type A sorting domain-containing protein [Saprospirales bacterium]|nr:T9SS type A sorting domain-containing protein [Saprospirales bacterium]MBK8489783.1 T9SS type A sorting domain-containing protein [Saprospirales bacterium]
MKYTLLALSFLVFTFNLALAQVELSPNPWIGTMEEVDLSDFWSEPIAHGEMTNTSGNPISVRWELVVISAPEEWDFRVCDKNACYATGTLTNWDPANNIEEPVLLGVDSSGLLDLHILPRKVAGTCEVEIKISLTGTPSTVITTGVYQVTVPTGVDEVSVQSLRIFPNPSSDYFALTSAKGVNKIMLYNVLGRVVRTFEVAEGKKYYIADLPDGMYLAGLIGRDGDVLRTMRISKRSLRP